jgi:glycolate oxidase FAD binding subunit
VSVAQTAPVLDLPWAQLVEWHGGLRWLWAPRSAAQKLSELAREYGGHATLFVAGHACSAGTEGAFSSKNAAELAIEARLKASFDPHGVFNPGRLSAAY